MLAEPAFDFTCPRVISVVQECLSSLRVGAKLAVYQTVDCGEICFRTSAK